MTKFEITPELLKQAKQAVNSAKYSATAERKKEAVDMLMKLAIAVQNLEEIEAAPKEQLKAKKAKSSKKKKAVHDNGRLARKARVTRNSNQRLDDLATKQSLDKLFDNAMALRY
jgi:hypothetical protein